VTVYLVGAGPGDPGLLTRRGADLLARADVVVYDRLVDRELLGLAPPTAQLIDAGKRPAGQQGGDVAGGPARQADINELLVRHGRAGRTVVRLKGGDPFVFGRGGEEAEALLAAGVPYEVVPGVTSAFGVPALAGVPVTHRGLSSSVTVVTGHVGDAPPAGDVAWEALAAAGGTIVILMGMANRAEIARRLQAGGRRPDTPVAVVEWGSTADERSVRTTLAGLSEVELDSPAVIVVGPVARLDLRSDPPLSGWTVVVTRAEEQAGGLGAAIEAAGARVIAVPTIAFEEPADGGAALAEAAARADGYDWVAFTSANAVSRFVPLLGPAGVGKAKLAAVGRSTAAALEAAGLSVDLVAAPATAAGLVASFPSAPPGGRVLFPRAEAARPTLARGLSGRGWTVDDVVAYRTVPVTVPVGVEGLASAEAVLFTSPSTVTGYLALRDEDGRPLPMPPVVACLGPVTAEAAREAGLEVAVLAAEPSAEGLVAGLATYRAGRSSR